MWNLLMVIALVKLATPIKVPIDNKEETVKDPGNYSVQKFDSKPIFYPSDENQGNPEIYNTHKSEGMRDVMEAPVTFLLPPSVQSMMYYKTPEQVEQNDWYPIAPAPAHNLPHQPFTLKSPELPETLIGNIRSGKVLPRDVLPPIPSRILLPPLENAPNYYFADQPSTGSDGMGFKANFRQPTNLYPKKFVSGYKPVPIPISQFVDNLTEIPKAKPAKPFKPQPSIDGIYFTPLDEKKTYLYEQAEQKRQVKKEHQDQSQYILPSQSTLNAEKTGVPSEQETSESIHDYPKDNLYPAPEKQNIKRPVYVPANKGERTEFRMHGMNGPHSYQFGYDTGKGKNRQFRYEERDNDGHVRGHYGYMDKQGKIRVVKYDADPKLGFRADPPVVQE